MSPHNIAADSRGNLYVAEDLGGQRVQKFAFKGTVDAPLDARIHYRKLDKAEKPRL